MTKRLQQPVLRIVGTALKGIGSFVAWLLALAAGCLFLAAGLHGVRNPTDGYLPTTGRVMHCVPSVSRGDPTTSSRNIYSVRVGLHYRYAVDGVNFAGMDLLDVGRTGSPSEAQEMAAAASARWKPGAGVELFFDPERPHRSTLERASRLQGGPALFFGLLFLVFAVATPIVSLVDAIRNRRLDSSPNPLWRRRLDQALNGVALFFIAALMLSALAWGFQEEPIVAGIFAALALVVGIYLGWQLLVARSARSD